MPKLKIPIELQKYENPMKWVKENCNPILLENKKSKHILMYSALHPEDSPICKYSGLIRKYSRELQKFTECILGKKCQCHKDKYQEIVMNRGKTCMERYGVANPMQVEEVKNKLSNTNLEKYGFKNPFSNKEIQNKIKNTNLEKYGCANPASNDTIKEKIQHTWKMNYGCHPQQTKNVRNKTEKTCIEKYGAKTPFLNTKIQNKIKDSMVSNYGVEYALQSEEFQKKQQHTISERFCYDEDMEYYPELIKRMEDSMVKLYGVHRALELPKFMDKLRITNQRNYGYEFASQSPEIKLQVKNYFLRKYDCENYSQLHISKESLNILNDLSKLEEVVISNGIQNSCVKLGISESTLYKRLRKLDSFVCRGMRSITELEIDNWLTENNILFESNNRTQIKPYELDFYFFKYNKAIEFQGDYWHMNPTIFEADDFNEIKNKTAFEIWKYDLNKFELSKAKHIDIFYIWESDWNLNKEKIKLKVLDFLKQF